MWLAIGLLALGHQIAHADNPPTAEEVAAAKQAFEEGNALYKAGKLVPAIEKLRESYRLSRNPFLLFNIGRIYDQLGQKEVALHYFRKFGASAAPDAPMRAEVTKRVAELERAGVTAIDPEAVAPAEGTPAVTPGRPAVELAHVVVESAPPNVPVEIVAHVKESGLAVTLHYRGRDDDAFTPVAMTARADALVAQIPGEKMHGNYVQYYLEAKDGAGTMVARMGKRTSPNLINIEGASTTNVGFEFDPLSEKRRRFGEGPDDAPPTPYFKESWISTGVAGALLGTTIVMYVLASKQSDRLRDDSTSCGTPPCTPFDKDFDARLETLGKRYNLAYQITAGLTVASAGVAGYFWYRRVKAGNGAKPTDGVSITPVIGDGFAGAATVGRF